MDVMNAAAVFLVLTALLSYLNARFLRLPAAIGLMAIALVLSLAILALDGMGLALREKAAPFLAGVDLGEALMQGMLSFLLFAGAIHVDLSELARQKLVVGLLATVGVVLSTALVGIGVYLLLPVLGLDPPLIYCLLFGALISPTDPVAVLAILKSTSTPKSLETKIAGESLFNDGVGIVVFLVLAGIATKGGAIEASDVAVLFVHEALGGVGLGLVLGLAGYRLLKDLDDYSVEIIITIALVAGGYALASALHMSGPIAVVVAGLFIGNHGRAFAMSERTRMRLDQFWELIDELLNAVLFLWIGMEVLILPFSLSHVLAGLVAIPLVLSARLSSVGSVVSLLRLRRDFSRGAITILTWGGLRGGISVALALSIPAGPERDLLLVATYVVVVFSILVQGLTVKKVLAFTSPA